MARATVSETRNLDEYDGLDRGMGRSRPEKRTKRAKLAGWVVAEGSPRCTLPTGSAPGGSGKFPSLSEKKLNGGRRRCRPPLVSPLADAGCSYRRGQAAQRRGRSPAIEDTDDFDGYGRARACRRDGFGDMAYDIVPTLRSRRGSESSKACRGRVRVTSTIDDVRWDPRRRSRRWDSQPEDRRVDPGDRNSELYKLLKRDGAKKGRSHNVQAGMPESVQADVGTPIKSFNEQRKNADFAFLSSTKGVRDGQDEDDGGDQLAGPQPTATQGAGCGNDDKRTAGLPGGTARRGGGAV